MKNYLVRLYKFLLIIQLVSGKQKNTSTKGNLSDKKTDNETLSLEEIFNRAEYQKHKAPLRKNGELIPVQIDIYMHEVPNVDEAAQTLKVNLRMNIFWPDNRFEGVAGDDYSVYVDKDDYKHIWSPGFAFVLARSRILAPPIPLSESVRTIEIESKVNQTARVVLRIDMEISTSCHMDFTRYPADTLKCELPFWFVRVSSKIFNLTAELFFRGMGETSDYYVKYIQGQRAVLGDNETAWIHDLVEYKRKPGFHVLQTYIPSLLLVILSLFSFVIRPDAVSDRLALCTTTLLTLTALFGAARMDTPKVSYIKALDIWMVFCVAFVFFVVAENIIVLNVIRGTPPRRKKEEQTGKTKRITFLRNLCKCEPNEVEEKGAMDVDTSTEGLNQNEQHETDAPDENEIRAKKIDKISLILAIAVFVCFVSSYWLWLKM